MDNKKEAARLLNEVRKKLAYYMKQRMDHGELTVAQAFLVGHVYHKGKMKISEIGKILGLSNSTVSGIVDRLEKSNTLKRIRSENDRRVVFVEITDDFHKRHASFEASVEGFFKDLTEVIENGKIIKLIEGLSIINEALDIVKEAGDKTDDKNT